MPERVVAPYIHFVILHRTHKLLAECAILALLVALDLPLLSKFIAATRALIWMILIINFVIISTLSLASSSELLVAVLSAQNLGLWRSTRRGYVVCDISSWNLVIDGILSVPVEILNIKSLCFILLLVIII